MTKKGYKQTKEHKKKISGSLKKIFKDKTKHPCFGKKHNQETKRKIGMANKVKQKEYWKNNKPSRKQKEFQKKGIKERCPSCGIIIYNKNRKHNCKEIKEKVSKANLGKIVSMKTRLKIKKSNMGKHNKGEKKPMELRIKMSAKQQKIPIEKWNGFRRSYLERLRKSSLWKIWREAVFLRDNFTCQNPNCSYCHNKIGFMLHPHHIKPFALYPKLRFNISNGITYCAEFHLKSNLHKRLMQGGS